MSMQMYSMKLLVAVGAIALGTAEMAQARQDVFSGGSEYVTELNGETAVEQADRLPNSFFVEKRFIPSMAATYKNCARAAGFRRSVEARARIYSSHFLNVTLMKHPKMTSAQFNSAVACSKRAVTPTASFVPKATPKPTVAKPVTVAKPAVSTKPKVAKSSVGVASPSASFSVKQASLSTAQNTYARCVSASGYRSAPQLEVQRFDGALAKISLVRSSTMTTTQYDSSIACMAKKVDTI